MGYPTHGHHIKPVAARDHGQDDYRRRRRQARALELVATELEHYHATGEPPAWFDPDLMTLTAEPEALGYSIINPGPPDPADTKTMTGYIEHKISARIRYTGESPVYTLRSVSLHMLAPNRRPSAPKHRRSIRRWIVAMAALTLLTALTIAPWSTAEAQMPCNNSVATPDSTNSGLIADCNTLLSLMATLAGTANLNWSETTTINSWNGIMLGDSSLRVTGLDLSSKSLTGTIPSNLGDLSNLRTLNLSANQLQGTIPYGLGDLSNLRTLNLSANQLAGTIPSALGDLSNLTNLDLSVNQLAGTIPSALGDLSNLTNLDLSGNSLTGPIPSKLGNLSNLTTLNLSNNKLDWAIPKELNQLQKLQEIQLNDNSALIAPAHLDFTELSTAHLGYMETETWPVANFSSATTWTLSGLDSGKFAIGSDGVLTFNSPPDYEVPSSAYSNNRYEVKVTASIGESQNTAEISVSVIDRDFALSVSPVSIAENDSSSQFTVTATRDGGTTQDTATTITLSLLGTATGSGTDYTAVVPLVMTIPAQAATGTTTLSITPTNDQIVEGKETIRIEGTVGDSTVSPAWININDDDHGELSLSVPDTDVAEDKEVAEDPDTTFEVNVALSRTTGPEVTVVWSVTPDSATSDDYCIRPSTPNDDCIYSGTLTFPAGSAADSKETFAIFVKDDALSEVEESFTISLGAVTGDISDRITLDANADSAVLTIDPSDQITVTLSESSSVNEGESVTYTVSLSPHGVTPTADLTVEYDTTEDTADSNDYEDVSNTLTFTPSDAAAEIITVQTTDDYIAEDEESFSFELSNVAGGGGPTPTLGDPRSITTTIDDDDPEPTAITLSVNSDQVNEGDLITTTVTLTATLVGVITRDTATTVALSLSGTATKSDTDYTAVLPSVMTIPAEARTGTATLSVTPTNDQIVEGKETIHVEGAASGFTVSPARININDDDHGELSLSGSATTISEGNDTSYTVSLSHAIAHEVTVGWSVTPNTGDFSTPSGSMTFAAGPPANATSTLTLTATDDLLSEVSESFTISLGAITGDISDRITLDANADSAVLQIEPSDPITVTLSGDSSVDEGELASYTISLSPHGVTPTAALTVDYNTADGTASSDDYKEMSRTLAFKPSDATAVTLTVQTTEDSIAEDKETFSLRLSSVTGGGGPTPTLGDPWSITTTIDDDDRQPTPRPPANDAPTFNEGARTTRAVPENSEVGTKVGEPVRANDRDGNWLEYSWRGPHGASFHLDPRTGQLTTALVLDYENQIQYSVRVRVRDGQGGIDSIEVRVHVSNVDEAGTVSVSPEQPEVGTALIASLSDPDGSLSGISWQWARSSDGPSWRDISAANSNSYTPVANDVGIYLQATASYTDGHGPGKSAHAVMERQTAQRSPSFEGNVTLTVNENTPPGSLVGHAITAQDPEGDVLTYSLSGTDASSFVLDGLTGQITVRSGTLLDYESEPTRYTFVVSVHDGRGTYGDDDSTIDDLIEVSIHVSNVDEAGTVSVSPEQPEVQTALVASLGDPDGSLSGISWQWARSSDRSDWQDMTYASSFTYIPVDLDADKYLRVTASYSDGEGSSKQAQTVLSNPALGLPEPVATPTTTATATATATVTPAPEPTPTRTLAAPTPTPTPTPTSPAPTPTPTPTPTLAAPTPTAEPAPSTSDGGDEGFPWWVIAAVFTAVLLIIVVLRRRI